MANIFTDQNQSYLPLNTQLFELHEIQAAATWQLAHPYQEARASFNKIKEVALEYFKITVQ